MFCTNCGSTLKDGAKFCSECGTSLSIDQSTNHQESHTGDEELRLFVGEKSDYYINKWNKTKNGRSWNWAAFFAGLFWVGYRKMYKVILIAFGIFILFDIIALFMDNELVDALNYGISMGLAITFGSFGNYFYFTSAKRKIQKVKDTKSNNPELQSQEIQKSGGGSWKGVFITFAMFVLYIGINFGLLFIQDGYAQSAEDNDVNNEAVETSKPIEESDVDSNYYSNENSGEMASEYNDISDSSSNDSDANAKAE